MHQGMFIKFLFAKNFYEPGKKFVGKKPANDWDETGRRTIFRSLHQPKHDHIL